MFWGLCFIFATLSWIISFSSQLWSRLFIQYTILYCISRELEPRRIRYRSQIRPIIAAALFFEACQSPVHHEEGRWSVKPWNCFEIQKLAGRRLVSWKPDPYLHHPVITSKRDFPSNCRGAACLEYHRVKHWLSIPFDPLTSISFLGFRLLRLELEGLAGHSVIKSNRGGAFP